jgi:hypothetical protein
MLHKIARFSARNKQGYVAILDADNPRKVRRINVNGSPVCGSQSDELLVVRTGIEEPGIAARRIAHDAELQVWHIGRNTHLTTVRFGPQNRLLRGEEEFQFRRCDACFARDDSVLIGGADDGTVRFWDMRLFVTRGGNPQPAIECAATDLSMVSEDRANWPEWWQRCGIEAPENMLPNPDFGKELRVIGLKMNCNGLQLKGVKGLGSVVVPGMDQPTAAEVRQWFRDRGACA